MQAQPHALLRGGVVDNVVLLSDGPVLDALAAQYDHVVALADGECGPGWLYDHAKGMFTAPVEPEPAPRPRHITVGAFLLRFGQNMVPILTSTDPVVQALCILVRAMTYIDLDDARLTQQLPYLVQAKLLTLEELQDVLAAEIQPKERP